MSRKADGRTVGSGRRLHVLQEKRFADFTLFVFLEKMCFIYKLHCVILLEGADRLRWPGPGPSDARPGPITPRSHTLTQITHEVLTVVFRWAVSALLAALSRREHS